MSAREVLQRGWDSWLVIGNACVDVLAGSAATMARVPEADRFRVHQVERKARLVRRRLLRVGLDSIQASQAIKAKER
eukprot:8976271-Pyramimonas_sp.AAC.1